MIIFQFSILVYQRVPIQRFCVTWQATIRVAGRFRNLGLFHSPEEVAEWLIMADPNLVPLCPSKIHVFQWIGLRESGGNQRFSHEDHGAFL